MVRYKECELEIELLCGIINESGEVVKDCIITAMTGGLRKKIAQPEVRKEGIKVMNAVMDECIKSIGGQPFIASRELKKMSLADADFILMKIRKLSLGDEILLDMACPSCGEKYKAELLISEIECFPLDDAKFEIEGDDRVFKIKTENWDAVFRLPNREDQKIVAKLSKNNPIQAVFQMYSRMIVKLDGADADPALLLKEFNTMPVEYIDELDAAVEEFLPGVESIHYSDCVSCFTRIQMEVSGSDFLFSKPKEQTRRRSVIG